MDDHDDDPVHWQVGAAGRQRAAVGAANCWLTFMPLRARAGRRSPLSASGGGRHLRAELHAPRPQWGALRALRRWLQARGALMPEPTLLNISVGLCGPSLSVDAR
jgi:hypothetical protein